MGFWDSLAAGFYGAAGVDYYSMKNNEELRGLRSDLAALPDGEAQDVFAYLQFLSGTFGTVEPLLMQELPLALRGDDAARVAWATKAEPICNAVDETVQGRQAPSRATVLKYDYGNALRNYGYLAVSWIESAGVHTDFAKSLSIEGAASWEHAVDNLNRLGDRLAMVR